MKDPKNGLFIMWIWKMFRNNSKNEKKMVKNGKKMENGYKN